MLPPYMDFQMKADWKSVPAMQAMPVQSAMCKPTDGQQVGVGIVTTTVLTYMSLSTMCFCYVLCIFLLLLCHVLSCEIVFALFCPRKVLPVT